LARDLAGTRRPKRIDLKSPAPHASRSLLRDNTACRAKHTHNRMNTNPYESPTGVAPPRKTRGTRWAIWSGVACLLLAAICALLTVAGMVLSFQSVAESATPPRPEDLATGISIALIPAFGIVPLGLLGVVLLIVGLVVRRPVEESRDE